MRRTVNFSERQRSDTPLCAQAQQVVPNDQTAPNGGGFAEPPRVPLPCTCSSPNDGRLSWFRYDPYARSFAQAATTGTLDNTVLQLARVVGTLKTFNADQSRPMLDEYLNNLTKQLMNTKRRSPGTVVYDPNQWVRRASSSVEPLGSSLYTTVDQ